MTKDEIKEFQQGIGTANWMMSYDKFCEITGFEPSDYTLHKFGDFQQLAAYLGAFDAGILEKIFTLYKK